MTNQPHSPNRNDLAGRHGSRRGISVMWLVIWMPVLLIMLAIVVNLANVWLARVELENALEAAALAASKEWGSGGSTAIPRDVGVTYAEFNTVRGVPLEIATNLDPAPSGSNPNAIVGIAIIATEMSIVRPRPIVSPSQPNTTAPSGRIKNPAAKTP